MHVYVQFLYAIRYDCIRVKYVLVFFMISLQGIRRFTFMYMCLYKKKKM